MNPHAHAASLVAGACVGTAMGPLKRAKMLHEFVKNGVHKNGVEKVLQLIDEAGYPVHKRLVVTACHRSRWETLEERYPTKLSLRREVAVKEAVARLDQIAKDATPLKAASEDIDYILTNVVRSGIVPCEEVYCSVLSLAAGEAFKTSILQEMKHNNLSTNSVRCYNSLIYNTIKTQQKPDCLKSLAAEMTMQSVKPNRHTFDLILWGSSAIVEGSEDINTLLFEDMMQRMRHKLSPMMGLHGVVALCDLYHKHGGGVVVTTERPPTAFLPAQTDGVRHPVLDFLEAQLELYNSAPHPYLLHTLLAAYRSQGDAEREQVLRQRLQSQGFFDGWEEVSHAGERPVLGFLPCPLEDEMLLDLT